GGFKRDSSTILQALVFHDMQFSQKGILVFIDYKRAFDSGRPFKLFGILRARGISDDFISVFQSLYYGGKTQVVVNGALTEKILQQNGFTQGGPTSPIAWNLYIDPLAQYLNGKIPRKDPVGYLWADDVCLRFNKVLDVSHIQTMLEIATQYGREYYLSPSISKCGVIIPTNLPVDKQTEACKLKFHDNTLPVVKTYKYLGFDVDQNGINLKLTAKRLFEKAMKVLSCLEWAGVTWSPFERLIMFKIFCLSIPLYIGPFIALLKLSHYKADQSAEAVTLFRTLLEEGLKWVYSCSKVTYIERNLAGLPLVEQIFYNTARTLKKQVIESRTVTAATVSYEKSKSDSSGLLGHELIPKLRYIKFPERYPEKPLKVATQSETLEFLLKEGSMGSYCSRMGRGLNGVCRELKLKGEKAHLYLKWRQNRPLSVRCPVCDE
ncbi:hypothetical protein MP638_001722, partial [Amoeboaphelidium occidentale]